MKSLSPILILVLTLSGCITTSSVVKEYDTVDFSNGIGSDEALKVARKMLLEAEERSQYKLGSAVILRDRFVREHPDHWFVHFSPKAYDHSFWRYLVVIDRKTGEIIHSGAYVPLEVVDYEWVFEK